MTKIDIDQIEPGKGNEGKAPGEEVRFGVLFRAARESSGFTIERAAMATRISQPFIEALEKDDFDKLPGAVFGRGFIRNLCKTYGKDSTELVAAFEYLTNSGKGKDIAISHRDEKRHQQLKKGVLLIQPNEWKGRIKALAPHHYLRAKPLALIVAGVLFGGFLFNQFKQEDMPSAVSENQQINQEDKDLSATAVDPSTSLAEEASKLSTPAPMTPPATDIVQTPSPSPNSNNEIVMVDRVDGQQDVEIRVKQTVNVKITKDSEKQVSEVLQPNTYHYHFKELVKFYIEDMSAVDIYFQGQQIPNSGIKGESRRLSFQAAEKQVAKKPSAPRL